MMILSRFPQKDNMIISRYIRSDSDLDQSLFLSVQNQVFSDSNFRILYRVY
jgi:hypothetical protein